MTDQKEETRMYMQLLEQECYIDATKEVEYPPMAISMGEFTMQTSKGLKNISYTNRNGTKF